MIVSGFQAKADIVGRRIRVAWDFVPEESETLADIPPVSLRRKLRDFDFPDPTPIDPYLAYNSSSFPPVPIPGTLAVTDLTNWQTTEDGERTVFEPVSVAVSTSGRMVEILRRTTGTAFDSTGVPVRQRVEILDSGQYPGDLQANTVYYYQLFGRDLPASGDAAAPYRGTAMVTDSYALNRTLYQLIPEIYRRHDVEIRPITPGTDTVPEEAPLFGQLRRFVDLFGISLDSMRGTAEGLRTLHDIDNVDAQYLPLLAQWIGWELGVTSEIPLRRNEIKAAPRLYRLVGTLPGLRALVSQYTGWFTQVAEFAQNLAISNRPPQRNLFAVSPAADGSSWHGVNDAAEVLGFGSTNQAATGSTGVAAVLTGTAAEPFALRAGMSLTVAADGLLPAAVRFGQDDFTDPGHATAAEVAQAMQPALPDLKASASGGHLALTSLTVGDQSELQILPEPTSLVSLESAPAGRLSPQIDSQGRIRVFYEARETPTLPEAGAPSTGGNAPSLTGAYVVRNVHYKTLLDGLWRDSHPIFSQSATPQADPAAVALPDDRNWVAWVDNPQTDASRVRFAVGPSQVPLPAALQGQRLEPFALTDGAMLTLTGNWSGTDRFVVHAANFANVARASANEVVAAMNAQLTKAVAVREANGSIGIQTIASGDQATLAVDLRHSTTAIALGFDYRNAVGTPGSWSEEIDWSPPLDAVSIGPRRHAELAAINEVPSGVRLAWSSHRAGLWRINTAHWGDQVLVGTANGLFLRLGAGPWATVAGLPSSDVRAVALDSDGTVWIATANGVALRRPNGTVVLLAPALPSSDVRSVTLGREGTAWFATAGGVATRAADGTVTMLTTAGGLPSNDVRTVAVADDGTLWIATAAGVMERLPGGAALVFGAGSRLPSSDARDVAIGVDGAVFIATAAGLATQSPGTGFKVVDASNGLPSPEVRAVTVSHDGDVWVATAGGVSRRTAGSWTTINTAQGLASNDARTLSVGADGSIWVGTAAGISLIATDGTILNLDLIGGGAVNPAGQSIQTGWSAPRELASDGGANREATLTVDETSRTWLVWSKQLGIGNPDESWGLHYRIFDPVAGTWGPDATLTGPPTGGRSSDRTPSAMRIPGGVRVFFSSDRNGGFGLWSVDVNLAGVIAPLISLFNDESSNLAPAPVSVGSALWLLYRGDRNVALAQIGSSTLLRSQRVPDNGTVRRFAGSVSMTPGDLERMHTRRSFGDMLSYTPNRPDGAGSLADDEFYTRGTVGLYVSRADQGSSALTQEESSRLLELLADFVPVNLRVLVIVVAAADTELVYGAGTDIQDSYRDVYPFADALGPIADQSAAAMPGLMIIHSNVVDNVSANLADLTTLRRRTFFPPLQ